MSVRAGRYELRERIATGAMAEVYEAFDPTIGRRLACKILNTMTGLGMPDSVRVR